MLMAVDHYPTRPTVLPNNLYRQLQVDEWTVQNRAHDLEISAQIANTNIANSFIAGLSGNIEYGSDQSESENRHVVNNSVSLKSVLEDLLLPMNLSTFNAPDFSALNVAIVTELKNNPEATADVYLMSAASDSNVRERTLTETGVIQPFQGPSPADGSLYPGDRQLHGSKLTVQIHNVLVKNRSGDSTIGPIPLIAVWIPKRMAKSVLVETG